MSESGYRIMFNYYEKKVDRLEQEIKLYRRLVDVHACLVLEHTTPYIDREQKRSNIKQTQEEINKIEVELYGEAITSWSKQ